MALYRNDLPKKEAEVPKNTGLYPRNDENGQELLKKEAEHSIRTDTAQNLSTFDDIVNNTAEIWRASYQAT